jgi:hypothetical protein
MVALFHGSLWLSLSQHRSDALMRSGSLMAALLSALCMTSCFIHSFIHSCAPKLPQHLLFQPLTYGGEGRNRTRPAFHKPLEINGLNHHRCLDNKWDSAFCQ